MWLMNNDFYKLCFQKLLCIVNRSSYKEDQLKLHRSLILGVKGGGGQKQPTEQPSPTFSCNYAKNQYL